MPSDPAAEAPPRRPDDIEMVKLQKAMRLDQRRSLAPKDKVSKLSPAEIRSLNHAVGLSKTSSLRSVDGHSVHRRPSATPPLTPDNYHPQYNPSRRSQSLRRPSTDLPTPPLSPDRDRRGSTSSTRHIHAPRPLSHAQAVHLTNTASLSRPSSQGSYRGVTTYRGNEITRNNSLTMLQHPSQQIVSNPLSQFSRPRQSTMTSSTSPPKPASEHQFGEDIMTPVAAKDRTRSLGARDPVVTREHSPIRPSDSPVSMDDGEVPHRRSQKKAAESDEVPVLHITPKINEVVRNHDPGEPSAKQKLNWRRTLTGSSEPDPEIVPLRKEFRRRTLLSPKNGYCLHAIHYEDTKPGNPPQLRDSLRDELPSALTSVFKEDERSEAAKDTEFGQHPAVRPLSNECQRSATDDSGSSPPSSSKKGKERETDAPDSDASSLSSSVPSYSKCSCCGRIQKPGGFESELSPVMENENLRSNFNMEAEKMTPNHRRSSSSVNPDGSRKYIPIIPMEIGNQTKQARIEPQRESRPTPVEPQPVRLGVAVNKLGDIIGPSSTPLAIMPRRKVDPRIVRFASLHRTKEDAIEDNQQSSAGPVQDLAPPPTIQRFGSLYGMRNEYQQQQQQQQPQQEQPQQLQEPQQYQQPQERPSSPSPYSPQQIRPPPRTNGYHPLREAQSAYHEMTVTPNPESHAYDSYIQAGDAVVEKPLGDSPVSQRIPIATYPESNFSNDDGAMVDLSSFDGSFNRSNIARSDTVIRDATPQTTSQGQYHGQNQNHYRGDDHHQDQAQSYSQNETVPAVLPSSTPYTSSTPLYIDTTNNNSLDNVSVHSATTYTTQAPITYSSPPILQQQQEDQRHPTHLNTNTSTTTSSTSTAVQTPTSAVPSTIVKMIPSPHVPSPTSAHQINGRGPIRLGDWVLPKASTAGSKGEREQLRSVAAA